MSDLILNLTPAGLTALVNAQNTGTNAVVISHVGVSASSAGVDGGGQLAGEIKRMATIGGAVVADDTIHINILDNSSDSYALRAFALYLSNGILFAWHAGTTDLMVKSSQADMMLTADARFTGIDVSSVTFAATTWHNPPATTEISGVVEMATPAEGVAGVDPTRAMTPAADKAALDARLGAEAPTSYTRHLLSLTNVAAFRAALELGNLATRNGGAGGGADADLLDGQHGDWYRQWGNLTGKPSTFPPASHTHAWADVTGIPSTATRWPTWGEVTGKPSSYTPSSHTHAISDVIGLRDDMNDKAATATRFEAGPGLIGGGTLSADRLFALGTPGTLSGSTKNIATDISHTHELSTNLKAWDTIDPSAKLNSEGPTVTRGYLTLRPFSPTHVEVHDGYLQSYVTETIGADGNPAWLIHYRNGTGTLVPMNLQLRGTIKTGPGGLNDVWHTGTFDPNSKAQVDHTHNAADVTSGTFANARIASGNVTQHQAALSIGWGQLIGVPTSFPPSVHSHDASNLTSGVINDSRFPARLTPNNASNPLDDCDNATVAGFYPINGSTLNTPQGSGPLGSMLIVTNFSHLIAAQIFFHYHGNAPEIYHRLKHSSAGWQPWKRLWDSRTFDPNSKAQVDHTHTAADVTSGTFANARIASGNVTQHQAALSIGWGQLTGIPTSFPPSGHTHTAADVTSGTFANARIASGNVTQHQAALSIGWGQLTGIPASFLPSAHTHTIANVTGLQAALDAKASLAGATFTGAIAAPTITASSSDARLKTDIIDLPDCLETVCRLQPRAWRWRQSGQYDFGFVAQEHRGVIHQAVHEGDDGMLFVRYGKVEPLLVGAVQQLLQRIQALEGQLAELQATR